MSVRSVPLQYASGVSVSSVMAGIRSSVIGVTLASIADCSITGMMTVVFVVTCYQNHSRVVSKSIYEKEG